MIFPLVSLSKRPRARLWLAVTGSLLLAACVSAPDIQPQQQQLDSQQLGLSQESLAQVPDGWWQAFGDDQLNQLVALALSGNPSLAQALARVQFAQAQAQAAGAALKPGFSLNGKETYQRLSENYI